MKLAFWVDGLLKLAKGSALLTGCAFGDAVEVKLRLLNASSRPPDVCCCCELGDCIPPNMSWLSCGGCDCVRGAEEYKERMDCLRSGLEGAVGPLGVDVALDGLAEDVEGGPPKKSSPRRESPCFCGFAGAAGAFGGGSRTLGVSVVLGRAGGAGTSPNKSI